MSTASDPGRLEDASDVRNGSGEADASVLFGMPGVRVCVQTMNRSGW